MDSREGVDAGSVSDEMREKRERSGAGDVETDGGDMKRVRYTFRPETNVIVYEQIGGEGFHEVSEIGFGLSEGISESVVEMRREAVGGVIVRGELREVFRRQKEFGK